MLIRNFLFSLFALCLTHVPGSASAAEAKLRAVSFQPESIVFAKHFYRWIREANDRCDGHVEITVDGPEKIDTFHQWHALKNGDIDMYFGPANYYRGALPQADVLNLAENSIVDQRKNGAWTILNTLHNEHLNAWYLTALLDGLDFYIYTTKPAQAGRFDGTVIRSAPLYEFFLRSLGATPRHLSTDQVAAALQSGEIGGFVWPMWGTSEFGWHKHAKYRYGPGFLNAAAPILINLQKWNSLDPNQTECLTSMALWLEDQWPIWRSQETEFQKIQLDKAGIQYKDLEKKPSRSAEDFIWSQIKLAQPEYLAKIRPLLQVEK